MEMDGKAVMSLEDFRLIKEFVAENFGLLVENGKEGYLSSRLLSRLEELRLSSFAEYYAYLKFAPGGTEERLQLVSRITNNETYFFREEIQLRAFAEVALPALKERKVKNGEREIRILSAGCSSGEEAYTLAMLVLESGCFAWDWDVKITGVDIDPKVIERAKDGTYSGRAFQSLPALYLDRFFRKCESGFRVKDSIRSMCSFAQGNLLDLDGIVSEAGVDIIFCRNVLIYFDDGTVKRIVENFARFLPDDGLLFLGHSESLSRITSRYIPIRFPGAIVYRVRG